jgi:hypothetical protein
MNMSAEQERISVSVKMEHSYILAYHFPEETEEYHEKSE